MKRSAHSVAVTEHDIQGQILEWLSLHRIFHYRNNTGAVKASWNGKERFVRYGVKGAPDIIAVSKGRYIGIEVKRAGKGLSDNQVEFRDALLEAGGTYIVACCLQDVLSAIPQVCATEPVSA